MSTDILDVSRLRQEFNRLQREKGRNFLKYRKYKRLYDQSQSALRSACSRNKLPTVLSNISRLRQTNKFLRDQLRTSEFEREQMQERHKKEERLSSSGSPSRLKSPSFSSMLRFSPSHSPSRQPPPPTTMEQKYSFQLDYVLSECSLWRRRALVAEKQLKKVKESYFEVRGEMGELQAKIEAMEIELAEVRVQNENAGSHLQQTEEETPSEIESSQSGSMLLMSHSHGLEAETTGMEDQEEGEGLPEIQDVEDEEVVLVKEAPPQTNLSVSDSDVDFRLQSTVDLSSPIPLALPYAELSAASPILLVVDSDQSMWLRDAVIDHPIMAANFSFTADVDAVMFPLVRRANAEIPEAPEKRRHSRDTLVAACALYCVADPLALARLELYECLARRCAVAAIAPRIQKEESEGGKTFRTVPACLVELNSPGGEQQEEGGVWDDVDFSRLLRFLAVVYSDDIATD